MLSLSISETDRHQSMYSHMYINADITVSIPNRMLQQPQLGLNKIVVVTSIT